MDDYHLSLCPSFGRVLQIKKKSLHGSFEDWKQDDSWNHECVCLVFDYNLI